MIEECTVTNEIKPEEIEFTIYANAAELTAPQKKYYVTFTDSAGQRCANHMAVQFDIRHF